MALIEKIKRDFDNARKSRSSKVRTDLLMTLFSEASMVGKNAGNREPTNDEVMVVLNKFLKGINETSAALSKRIDAETIDNKTTDIFKLADLQEEKLIIEGYLPNQLTDFELGVLIDEIIGKICEMGADKNIKLLGNVLKTLKAEYPGMYDTARAAEFAKKALS